jgi:hypothetical protein
MPCHRDTAYALGGNSQLVEVVGFGDFAHRTRCLPGGKQNKLAGWGRRQQRRQAGRRMGLRYRNAIKICEKSAQVSV